MSGFPFQTYATALPDLAAYAKRGLVPDDPELFAAIAEHSRITDAYLLAVEAKDQADAIVRSAPDGVAAISAAITRGEDPAEAADQAAKVRTDAAAAVERANSITFGFRTPVLTATWAVMGAVERYAPTAAKAIEKHLIEQGAAVDKARITLAKAQATLHETVAVAAWIDATHQVAGETFPRIDASVRVFE